MTKKNTTTIRLLFITLFLVSFIAPSHPASARDLQGRLGVGYNSEFSNVNATNGTPALSVKYAFTHDLSAEGIVGMNTESPSNSVTGVKLFKNIFFETNLNFYMMIGAGIISANNRSGADFLGGIGAEFFIPGIESLGFSFETGAAFGNASGSFSARTFGVCLWNAGIHFYF